MRWGTRSRVHVDRAASAWLIRRFVDPDAEFVFGDDPADLPPDARPFDVRGAVLSHRDADCTFETILADERLTDPALGRLARIVHEADLADDRYDAPEAPGLDRIIRGLSETLPDADVLVAARPIFDGLYALLQRETD